MYEICVVCWWEDEIQGDVTADEAWGGANGKYSLNAARSNFAAHGHMYDAGNGIRIVESPTKERLALVAYAKSVLNGEEKLDERRFRKLMHAASKSGD